MSVEAQPGGGAAPLRIDADVRQRLAEDGSPPRRWAVARLLMRHGMVARGLALLQDGDDVEARALRVAGCRRLGPRGRRAVWESIAAEVTADGTGRDAFELCILAGEEHAAERVAARTSGALGRELEAELSLRRGTVPAGSADLGGVNGARAAWLRGDVAEVARRAERFVASPAASGSEVAEVCLLQAALLRRRGELAGARALLDRARGAARDPMPVIGLEALLQHFGTFRVAVRDRDLLEPVTWALGGRLAGIPWWPGLRLLARRLRSVDQTIGPFRGEVPSRCVAGRVVSFPDADDVRQRAASLRTGLRVATLDEVMAVAAELDAAYPGSPVIPSYEAELLHWFGQYEAAGRRCEEAIRRDDSVRWAWIGLAQARMWTGDFRAARRALTTLAGRLPKLATLPAAFGELAWLEGRPDEAIDLLRRAVVAHPTRRAAWLLLARALAATGQTAEATGLAAGLRSAAPGAWSAGSGHSLAEELEAQLAVLRGNRSSSFVTLFPAEGPALLLQGAALRPPTVPMPTQGG